MTTLPIAQSSSAMTRAERTDLARLLRQRARVAKADAESQASRLLADFEAQLAARYPATHEAWKEITAEAQRLIAEADGRIADRCREMGICAEFRPSLHVAWYGRGENADKERRAELRRVAQAEIANRLKAAKVEIDRHEAALQARLTAGWLASADARQFLEAMPTIDELMPPIALAALENSVKQIARTP